MAEGKVIFEGGEELLRVLDGIPKNIRRSATTAAARKAAKPIVKEARNELVNSPAFKQKATKSGFSKLLYIVRAIKTVTYKGTVNIQVNPNEADVPVEGSKRSEWTVYGWARLLAQGRKWSARSTASRRAHDTGTTEGAGDFIAKATEKLRSLSNKIYLTEINKEVERAFDRAIKRFGKKA